MLHALLLPAATGLPLPAGRQLQTAPTFSCADLSGRTNIISTGAFCFQLDDKPDIAIFQDVQAKTGGGASCENYYITDPGKPGGNSLCYLDGTKCKGSATIFCDNTPPAAPSPAPPPTFSDLTAGKTNLITSSPGVFCFMLDDSHPDVKAAHPGPCENYYTMDPKYPGAINMCAMTSKGCKPSGWVYTKEAPPATPMPSPPPPTSPPPPSPPLPPPPRSTAVPSPPPLPSPLPPSETTASPSACQNSCTHNGDGDCDDGGEGSEYDSCAYGTDCTDCGRRTLGSPPLPPPLPLPPLPLVPSSGVCGAGTALQEPSGRCEIVCSSSRRLEQETDEPSQLKDPASKQLKASVEALVGSAKHRLSPDEITAALVAGLKDAGVFDQLFGQPAAT